MKYNVKKTHLINDPSLYENGKSTLQTKALLNKITNSNVF